MEATLYVRCGRAAYGAVRIVHVHAGLLLHNALIPPCSAHGTRLRACACAGWEIEDFLKPPIGLKLFPGRRGGNHSSLKEGAQVDEPR